MIHELKTWPVFYTAVADGTKPFEIRREDGRVFSVGDVLRLREWNPNGSGYTGRESYHRVSYVLRGPPFLPDGVCAMAIVDANVSVPTCGRRDLVRQALGADTVGDLAISRDKAVFVDSEARSAAAVLIGADGWEAVPPTIDEIRKPNSYWFHLTERDGERVLCLVGSMDPYAAFQAAKHHAKGDKWLALDESLQVKIGS